MEIDPEKEAGNGEAWLQQSVVNSVLGVIIPQQDQSQPQLYNVKVNTSKVSMEPTVSRQRGNVSKHSRKNDQTTVLFSTPPPSRLEVIEGALVEGLIAHDEPKPKNTNRKKWLRTKGLPISPTTTSPTLKNQKRDSSRAFGVSIENIQQLPKHQRIGSKGDKFSSELLAEVGK